MASIRQFLERELRLKVNEKKSKVGPVEECGFLGFVFVRGWMNYYGISEYYRPIPEIDEWLRRRIRMCFWKQWRYARTKVRHLLKLGTSTKEAILTAISRKGPWHCARTQATQSGMTNKWLMEQGLISVKDQWVKIHYPASVR